MRKESREAFLDLRGHVPPELDAENDLFAVHSNGVETLCFTVAVRSTGLEPERIWPPGMSRRPYLPDLTIASSSLFNGNENGNQGKGGGKHGGNDHNPSGGSDGNGDARGRRGQGPLAFQQQLSGTGAHGDGRARESLGTFASEIWNSARRNSMAPFLRTRGRRIMHVP